MSLTFMGETFESVEQLRRFYPAYCGNDAIRAIKAGANGKKLVQPTVSKAEKAKRQRKAGSAKGAATMQRRRAA